MVLVFWIWCLGFMVECLFSLHVLGCRVGYIRVYTGDTGRWRCIRFILGLLRVLVFNR